MRMRFGLDVRPAIGASAETQCGHVKGSGGRCPETLDPFGHHAAACGKGGGFVERHDGIVVELAARLRRMGFKVAVERWVDDVAESRPGGQERRARMDLVVQSGRGIDYLDVTCFHPFSAAGGARPPSSGGTPEAHEMRKRDRYPVRELGSRRRTTMARFVPVAVTTYGLVGPAAVALFSEYEGELRERKGDAGLRNGGYLAALVSEAAVFGAARMVNRGFSTPDGQEWLQRNREVAVETANPPGNVPD